MVINPRHIFVISGAVLLMDQLVKAAVSVYQPQVSFLGFGLTYATNTGIAFGALSGHNTVFIVAGAIIAGIIARSYRGITAPTDILATGLILGGTLGNLTDRVFRGAIIDYIRVPGIPTFNIADTALTMGASLIIAHFIVQKLKK
jgi:signal peptidase II